MIFSRSNPNITKIAMAFGNGHISFSSEIEDYLDPDEPGLNLFRKSLVLCW
jgi:hypothetical protein